MKKIIALILAIVMVLSFASCNSSESANDTNTNGESSTKTDSPSVNIKVGAVMISDPSDLGYSYNHYLGLEAMKEELGLTDDQIIYKYNIPETEACATALEELVAAGCNIIFANSFGHGDYVAEAAYKYPDVQFCHATGTAAASLAEQGIKNFHNYFTSIYQARYVAGVVAGLKLNEMIESGSITADKAVIGYVSAFYFEEIISGFTAFYLGARSVCPSATMITLKADSWGDPVKEAQITQTLIDQGAVIISQHSDNTSPATTAEANKLFQCGYNSDMSTAAPRASLISARADWSKYYTYAVKCVIDGEEIATDWCKGYEDGAVYTSPLNTAIAAEGTQEIIDQVEAELKAGTKQVFEGPYKGYNIWDSSVTVDIPAGEWIEESVDRSAPYFGYIIEGITLLDA